MNRQPPSRRVVVGVTATQPPVVVVQAARFARQFDAALVCAHVDAARYVVAEHADGSVESRPIDPDQSDWEDASFDPELADRIRALTEQESVHVELRELAGDVAYALARLADVVSAEMVVVGSRRGGLRSSVHEFFGGSVAAHLAHRQPRPVVVVPLTPVPRGKPLPWEEPRR